MPPLAGAGATPSALDPERVPEDVRQVLAELGQAGRRSWLVGGLVRDLVSGRARHDEREFDVASPATPAEVQRLFRRVIPTGIEHGTVTVLAGDLRVEVTTFRGEGPYVDGRRPSSVTFHTDLEADLARRDFTMNALAWDPLSGDFRDPFGGVADIRRGLIRAVGDPRQRFAEDGLRPLRAVRFAAQHGYRLHRPTLAAIRPARDVVEQVSRERLAEELSRLVVAPHAAAGLVLLEATDLLEILFPALASLPPSARRHAVAAASAPFRASRGDRDRLRRLRLAALLHLLPPKEARESVVALRLPGRLADGVSEILAAGPCLGAAAGALPGRPEEVRRWLSRVGTERSADVLEVWGADASHQGRSARRLTRDVRSLRRRVAAELGRKPPLSTADLALDGRRVLAILGTSGPVVGEALRHLLEVVVEDPSRNAAPALEAELRAWWAGRLARGPAGAGFDEPPRTGGGAAGPG